MKKQLIIIVVMFIAFLSFPRMVFAATMNLQLGGAGAESGGQLDWECDGGGYGPDGEGSNQIYSGYYSGHINWGGIRFTLSSALPEGTAVSNATVTLNSQGIWNWNSSTDYFRIFVTDSPDAPDIGGSCSHRPGIGDGPGDTTVYPNNINNGIRWPASGGLAWPALSTDVTSTNIAGLIQSLIDSNNGLASGAHIVIWIGRPDAGSADSEAMWLDTAAYTGSGGNHSAKLDITYTIPPTPTPAPTQPPSAKPFSVAAWVKPNSSITSKAIIVKQNEIRLVTDSSGNPLCQFNNGSSWQTAAVGNTALTTGVWQHIACTYDRQMLRVYKNGNQIGSQSLGNIIINQSANHWLFGHDEGGTYGDYNGQMDETRIFNTALSPSDITSLYSWSPGPVAYYKFDEGSGNIIDSSGNGNNIQITDTVSYRDGKFGKAVYTGSAANAINPLAVSDSPSLSLTRDFTISSWIKPDSVSGGTRYDIAGKWELTDTAYMLSQYGNQLRLYIGSLSNYVTTTNADLVAGNWYFIEAIYNAVDQTATIYVNGQLKSATVSGTIPASIADGMGRFTVGMEASSSGTTADCTMRWHFANTGWPYEIGAVALNHSGAQVTQDKGTGAISGAHTAGSVLSWSHTVSNAGTNRLLLVEVAVGGNFADGTPVTSVTYGSQGLIRVGTTTNRMRGEIWGLVNPPVGTNTITVTMPESVYSIMAGANNWWNVDQINPVGTFYMAAGDIPPELTASVTITGCSVGQAIVDVQSNTRSLPTADSTQVVQWYEPELEYPDYGSGSSKDITAGTAYIFNGTIDELKLYNYARTSSQITEDMNAGHPAPGSPVGSALGHWDFDEGSGSTANNSGNGGTALNGTITNGNWTNSGKLGRALGFNGTSTLVNMGSNPSIDNLFSNDATLTFWFNSNGTWPAWTYNGLFQKTDALNPTTGYNARLNVGATANSQDIFFRVENQGQVTLPVTFNVNDSKWHQLVLRNIKTGDAGNGCHASFYIDLVYQGTLDFGCGYSSDAANSFFLGRSYMSGSDYFYKGFIDDLKIYNLALTDDKLKQEYNQGKAQTLGSVSTTSSGVADFSAAGKYCVPGSSDPCSPPVGEWTMDEKSGTSVNDSSGNGNTGSFVGTPTWVTGKYGSGLGFKGDNTQRVVVNDSTSLHLSDFTLETWVKPNVNNVDHGLIGKRSTYTTKDWQFWLANDGKVNLSIGEGAGADYPLNACPYTTGSWIHLAATKNGNAYKLYKNGVLCDSGNSATTWTDSDSIVLGGMSSIGEGLDLNGSLDDARIYNYARTPAQIAWDYNKGKPLAWYEFGECSGTVAHNSALNGNGQVAGLDGTITPGAGRTAGNCSSGISTEMWNGGTTGKYGASLSFDGAGDYINYSSGPNIGSSEGTISFWMYPTDTAKGAENPVFSNSDNSYAFENISGQNNWGFNMSGTNLFTGAGVISTNQWQLVTLVWNGPAHRREIYVNGKLVSQDYLNTPSDTNLTKIGTRGTIDNRFFAGRLDDFRVYNYALTPAQVKNLYNNSSAVAF